MLQKKQRKIKNTKKDVKKQTKTKQNKHADINNTRINRYFAVGENKSVICQLLQQLYTRTHVEYQEVLIFGQHTRKCLGTLRRSSTAHICSIPYRGK